MDVEYVLAHIRAILVTMDIIILYIQVAFFTNANHV